MVMKPMVMRQLDIEVKTERQTERQTDRQTYIQTDRQTDRKTESDAYEPTMHKQCAQ